MGCLNPERSLFCFTLENGFRVRLLMLIHSKPYFFFMLVVIFANAVALGVTQPSYKNPVWMDTTLKMAEYAFLGVFGLEMLIKIIAYGLVLHPVAYLRDPWNVFDMAIVGISMSAQFTSIENISALLLLKILRPLKTIGHIKQLKILVNAMFLAMPAAIVNLVFLLIFLFVVTVIGVQLWAGQLHRRCYYDTNQTLGEFHLTSSSVAYELDSFNTEEDWAVEPSTFAAKEALKSGVRWVLDPAVSHRCGGYQSCPPGPYRCLVNRSQFDASPLTFDSFLPALLIALRLTTLDGWSADMTNTLNATSGYAIIWFVLVTLLGGYFLVNVFLGILMNEYAVAAESINKKEAAKKKAVQKKKAQEKRKKKKKQAKAAAAAAEAEEEGLDLFYSVTNVEAFTTTPQSEHLDDSTYPPKRPAPLPLDRASDGEGTPAESGNAAAVSPSPKRLTRRKQPQPKPSSNGSPSSSRKGSPSPAPAGRRTGGKTPAPADSTPPQRASKKGKPLPKQKKKAPASRQAKSKQLHAPPTATVAPSSKNATPPPPPPPPPPPDGTCIETCDEDEFTAAVLSTKEAAFKTDTAEASAVLRAYVASATAVFTSAKGGSKTPGKYLNHNEYQQLTGPQLRPADLAAEEFWQNLRTGCQKMEVLALTHLREHIHCPLLAKATNGAKGCSGLKAIGNAGSFIDILGLTFYHVWGSRKEARRFHSAFAALTRARLTMCLPPPLAVPYFALCAHQGSLVTVSFLPPLVAKVPTSIEPGSSLEHHVKVLAEAAHAPRVMGKLLTTYKGGDDAQYCLSVLPLVSRPLTGLEQQLAVDTCTEARWEYLSLLPSVQQKAAAPSDHFQQRLLSVPKELASIMNETVKSKSGGGGGPMAALLELLEQNTVSRVFHRQGVNLHFLYEVYALIENNTKLDRKLPDNMVKILKRLLLTEMVGRAAKSCLCQSLANIGSKKEELATLENDAVSQQVADEATTLITQLFTLKQDEVLASLRSKYRAPAGITFKKNDISPQQVAVVCCHRNGLHYDSASKKVILEVPSKEVPTVAVVGTTLLPSSSWSRTAATADVATCVSNLMGRAAASSREMTDGIGKVKHLLAKQVLTRRACFLSCATELSTLISLVELILAQCSRWSARPTAKGAASLQAQLLLSFLSADQSAALFSEQGKQQASQAAQSVHSLLVPSEVQLEELVGKGSGDNGDQKENPSSLRSESSGNRSESQKNNRLAVGDEEETARTQLVNDERAAWETLEGEQRTSFFAAKENETRRTEEELKAKAPSDAQSNFLSAIASLNNADADDDKHSDEALSLGEGEKEEGAGGSGGADKKEEPKPEVKEKELPPPSTVDSAGSPAKDTQGGDAADSDENLDVDSIVLREGGEEEKVDRQRKKDTAADENADDEDEEQSRSIDDSDLGSSIDSDPDDTQSSNSGEDEEEEDEEEEDEDEEEEDESSLRRKDHSAFFLPDGDSSKSGGTPTPPLQPNFKAAGRRMSLEDDVIYLGNEPKFKALFGNPVDSGLGASVFAKNLGWSGSKGADLRSRPEQQVSSSSSEESEKAVQVKKLKKKLGKGFGESSSDEDVSSVDSDSDDDDDALSRRRVRMLPPRHMKPTISAAVSAFSGGPSPSPGASVTVGDTSLSDSAVTDTKLGGAATDNSLGGHQPLFAPRKAFEGSLKASSTEQENAVIPKDNKVSSSDSDDSEDSDEFDVIRNRAKRSGIVLSTGARGAVRARRNAGAVSKPTTTSQGDQDTAALAASTSLSAAAASRGKRMSLSLQGGNASTLQSEGQVLPPPKLSKKEKKKMKEEENKTKFQKFVTGFGVFMAFITVVNVAVVAYDYYGIPHDTEVILDYINYGCTILFALELILKAAAFGPKKTFTDGFNLFDMFLVAIAVIEFVFGLNGLSALRAFRLLRAFRTLRLMTGITGVYILLNAIGPSIVPALFVFTLLLLLIYTYSVLGMNLFGTSVFPGVRVTYATIWDAALSNFVVITGDEWVGIMLAGFEASDELTSMLFFLSLFFFGNYIVINLFAAVIISNLESTTNIEWTVVKAEQFQELLGAGEYPPRLFLPPVPTVLGIELNSATSTEGAVVAMPSANPTAAPAEKYREKEERTKKTGTTTLRILRVANAWRKSLFSTKSIQLQGKAFACFGPLNLLRRGVASFVLSRGWHFFSVVITLLNLITIAYSLTPVADLETVAPILDYDVELGFGGFYALDGILTIFARGGFFPRDETHYLLDGTHIGGLLERDDVAIPGFFSTPGGVIDILVTASTFVVALVPQTRILRAFRPIRLVVRVKALRVTATAFLQAFPDMVQAFLLCLIFWFIFAILGVQLFKGKLYYCTDPDILDEANCTETYQMVSQKIELLSEHLPTIDGVPNATRQVFLSNATMSQWVQTYNASTTWFWNAEINSYERKWEPFLTNFDHLGRAALSLFALAVGDNWKNIMFLGMDGTEAHHGLRYNANQWASLYFITFYVIGNFFTMNLMLGVLINYFVRYKRAAEGMMMISKEQRMFLMTKRIIDVSLFRYIPAKPKNIFRRFFYIIFYGRLSTSLVDHKSADATASSPRVGEVEKTAAVEGNRARAKPNREEEQQKQETEERQNLLGAPAGPAQHRKTTPRASPRGSPAGSPVAGSPTRSFSEVEDEKGGSSPPSLGGTAAASGTRGENSTTIPTRTSARSSPYPPALQEAPTPTNGRQNVTGGNDVEMKEAVAFQKEGEEAGGTSTAPTSAKEGEEAVVQPAQQDTGTLPPNTTRTGQGSPSPQSNNDMQGTAQPSLVVTAEDDQEMVELAPAQQPSPATGGIQQQSPDEVGTAEKTSAKQQSVGPSDERPIRRQEEKVLVQQPPSGSEKQGGASRKKMKKNKKGKKANEKKEPPEDDDANSDSSAEEDEKGGTSSHNKLSSKSFHIYHEPEPIYEYFALLLNVVNGLSLCVDGTELLLEYPQIQQGFDYFHLAIVCWHAVEFLGKIIAVGPIVYMRSWWDRLDFVCTIVEVTSFPFGAYMGRAGYLARAVRCVRIFKLLTNFERAQKMFAMCIHGIPSLFDLVLLVGVVYYIFGVIGVDLFGKVQFNGALDPLNNFQYLHSAVLVLYQIMSTERWLYFMKSCMLEEPHCSLAAGDCGTMWALAYFVSFVFVSFYVLMQLAVSLIVEHFEILDECEQTRIIHSMGHLAELWQRHIGHRDSKAEVDSLIPLVIQLPSSVTKLRQVTPRTLFRFFVRLHLPIDDNGKVSYEDFAHAIVRHRFRVDARAMVPSGYVQLGEELPDRYSLTAGHLLASRLIIAHWRARKLLNEPESTAD